MSQREWTIILSINCFSDFSNESIATAQIVKKSSVLDNQYHRKTNRKCKTHGSKCLMPTLIKEAVFTSHLCLKPMGNVIFLEETSSSQRKVTCCGITCLQEKNYNSVFSVPSEFFSCCPLLKKPKALIHYAVINLRTSASKTVIRYSHRRKRGFHSKPQPHFRKLVIFTGSSTRK